MKKIIALAMTIFAATTFAKETITLYVGNAPNQPNVSAYIKTIEIANRIQDRYDFMLEFRAGANGSIALKAMDQSPQNKLATVAPAFVENAKQGLINESDYVPVSSQGEACWAVITNIGDTQKGIESLRGQREIVVGGTGFGNAAHLTAIILGEKYGFNVRYIVFKSNFDALVNMTGSNDINFVLERVQNFKNFREKNPRLQILGINCSRRNIEMPAIRTLKEQGVETPTIFFAILANNKMPESKRKEISVILESAQKQVGNQFLTDSADLFAPQFARPPIPVEEFFDRKVSQMHYLTTKYKEQINSARK